MGLKGFEEHTLLELLLFYAIPQKDTNALAHELIRRFGSLDGVLQASMAQLMQVNGVGENAARMLKVVAAVCQSCGQGLWEDRRPVLASTIERCRWEPERWRSFVCAADLNGSFWHIIIPAGWTAPPGRTWP